MAQGVQSDPYEPPTPPQLVPIFGSAQFRGYGQLGPCPHSFYSCADEFVDHLLWILFPSSTSKLFVDEYGSNEHQRVALKLMPHYSICTLCITLILSKVALVDLMHRYSRCLRYTSDTHATWIQNDWDLAVHDLLSNLSRWMLTHILYHPKMHKLMILSCGIAVETQYERKRSDRCSGGTRIGRRHEESIQLHEARLQGRWHLAGELLQVHQVLETASLYVVCTTQTVGLDSNVPRYGQRSGKVNR